MSKKSELIKIAKEEAYHFKNIATAIDMQSEYYINYHSNELENLGAKFDYIAADKSAALDSVVDSLLEKYNCSENSVEQYIRNLDTGNIARCAGVYELASIEAIEQLF